MCQFCLLYFPIIQNRYSAIASPVPVCERRRIVDPLCKIDLVTRLSHCNFTINSNTEEIQYSARTYSAEFGEIGFKSFHNRFSLNITVVEMNIGRHTFPNFTYKCNSSDKSYASYLSWGDC